MAARRKRSTQTSAGAAQARRRFHHETECCHLALNAPCWPERDSAHLLVTGAQMAALEQELFASGLPVEALMEKAALAAAAAIQVDWAERLQRHGAVVLAGPGHNGGDGLVIARELHLGGIKVAIWSPFERRKPLTAAHLSHAQWLGIPVLQAAPDPASPALWIDALFGIGQSRPLAEPVAGLLRQRHGLHPGALVAIDVPSGLHDTTGTALGAITATAAATYTIGLIKRGLVQDAALAAVGRLVRVELGLPAALLQSLEPATPLGLSTADSNSSERLLPPLDPAASKYERGRLLVIAGSEAYRGAALLALLGADASGLGSLRAALPPGLAAGLWHQLPHVVLQRQLNCAAAGALQLSALTSSDLERLDAVLLGPGIGALARAEQAGAAEAAAWDQLQRFSGLLVLDADGLNRITPLWLQQRRGPTWITPHRGEFARLWPQWAELPPLAAAPRAAAASGAAVLLKGARSVIAAPDGRLWQLLEAAPTSARAGLGDVLAGYVSAQGAMALASGAHGDAAWLAAAACAHATAGACAARCGSSSPAAVAQQLAQQLGQQQRTQANRK